jgi:hypothetical protein
VCFLVFVFGSLGFRRLELVAADGALDGEFVVLVGDGQQLAACGTRYFYSHCEAPRGAVHADSDLVHIITFRNGTVKLDCHIIYNADRRTRLPAPAQPLVM